MLSKKTRSKTGCRTCKIRKVKCDEEKLNVKGEQEPQCRRCAVARIRCEWRNGPIPRKTPRRLAPGQRLRDHDQTQFLEADQTQHLTPITPLPVCDSGRSLQAANSLTLSGFDRSCLDYLQDSVLVVVLGKHWPWSTISYTYRRVAVREPMVMSMILATTASEINRSRVFDCSNTSGDLPTNDLADVNGRMHYGQALSGLREALTHNVKLPEKLEAIFITLWLMVDYENRFGSGSAGIDVHMHGIIGLLFNHVLPTVKYTEALRVAFSNEGGDTIDRLIHAGSDGSRSLGLPSGDFNERLRSTTVPLFLLWILYFCTPGTLFCSSGVGKVDESLFRLFLRQDHESSRLTLPQLYKISRQSPSRFWGAEYPAAAHLDDLENLPGLNLYHASHVAQFKITELFKQDRNMDQFSWDDSPYKQLIDELAATSEEYDTVLSSAKCAPSCEFLGGERRVMETIYWASITYYSTIVYFYLCFKDLIPEGYTQHRWVSLNNAVSEVLELSLKLHRSRPRLMIRIAWPLFIAGIATPDKIYQDWVSIRLRELGRYGQNFARVSQRFDEIIQGSDPFAISLVENLSEIAHVGHAGGQDPESTAAKIHGV